MSIITAALRELIALGVAGDALVAAVQRIEDAATVERAASLAEAVEIAAQKEDARLAARRAKGAERTRKWREGRDAESVTVTSPSVTERHGDDCDAAPLSLPPSPRTPQPPTQSPGDINTRARPVAAKPNGFARFWEAYPNKVGKLAAEKAFAKALRLIAGPDPPAVLLAGVERAKLSRQWGEGYVPHPTTWLNSGGWEDEPAEVIPLQPRQTHERPHPDAKLAAKQANLARAWEGSERAARFRGEP